MKYRTNSQFKSNDNALINKISEGVYSASSKQKSIILGLFYSLFFYVVGAIALIPRIFLRTKLGERTIGIFSVFLIFSVIWGINFLYYALPNFINEINSAFENDDSWVLEKLLFFNLIISKEQNEMTLGIVLLKYIREEAVLSLSEQLKWAWYIILLLSVLHFGEVWNRKKNAERIHSYYRGNSLIFSKFIDEEFFGIKITNLFIWMILEPLFVFMISFVLEFIFFDPILGFLFRLSAVALFLEEWRVYAENRNMVLDIIDSNIDAVYINSVQVDASGSTPDDFTGKAEIN